MFMFIVLVCRTEDENNRAANKDSRFVLNQCSHAFQIISIEGSCTVSGQRY